MKIFTFGPDHKHPITGESLGKHYIQVPGNWDESRRIVLAVFGREWASQYADLEQASGFGKHTLTQVEWTDELRALLDAELPEDNIAWGTIVKEWAKKDA